MKMIFRLTATIVLLASAPTLLCAQQHTLSIIPKPVKLQAANGHVTLNASASIIYDATLEKQAQYLQQQVFNQCGIQLHLSPKKGSLVVLRLGNNLNKAESYILRTSKDSILIEGAGIKGVVNGIQTLFATAAFKAIKAGQSAGRKHHGLSCLYLPGHAP